MHQAAWDGDVTTLARLLNSQPELAQVHDIKSASLLLHVHFSLSLALLCEQVRLTQAKVIQWSEYDGCDRTTDHYKLTVKLGATPLLVARTQTADLDADSPQTFAVVQYLLDSQHGGSRRRLCLELLEHPERSVATVLVHFFFCFLPCADFVRRVFRPHQGTRIRATAARAGVCCLYSSQDIS